MLPESSSSSGGNRLPTNPANPAFHRHAALFTELFSLARDPECQADALATLLRSHAPASKHVVELGSGAGDMCAALRRKGYHVTGVDRSADMIGLAEQRHSTTPNLEWVHADFMVEPPTICADAVLLLYSIVQTFSNLPTQLECFARARSLLNPKGIVFAEFTNDPVIDKVYPSGQKFRSRSGARTIESWSREVETGVRELHLATWEEGSGNLSPREPVEFVHRLLKTDRPYVEDLIAQSGGVSLAWRNAPDFSRPFNPDASTGMLVIFTFV